MKDLYQIFEWRLVAGERIIRTYKVRKPVWQQERPLTRRDTTAKLDKHGQPLRRYEPVFMLNPDATPHDFHNAMDTAPVEIIDERPTS